MFVPIPAWMCSLDSLAKLDVFIGFIGQTTQTFINVPFHSLMFCTWFGADDTLLAGASQEESEEVKALIDA